MGRSALHIAARKGCAQCIKILLDHGAARTDIKDSAGDTPLHVSAAYNNLSAMQALYPASFEEESSVEFMDEYQSQHENRNQMSSSFYGSPREYHPNTQSHFDSWHHNNSLHSQLNDSGYFSTRSNGNAWIKSSYYDVPHKIEEEKESVERSSLDSMSDSLTVASTDIESDKWTDLMWLFAAMVRVVFCQIKSLISCAMPTKLQQGQVNNETGMAFTEPPSHIREAMEMYKLSRQRTFKAGSSSK